MLEMLSSSQPPVMVLPNGLSKPILPVQVLGQAQGEGVGYVEGRRPFFRVSVKGILRRCLDNRARPSGDKPSDHRTDLVERLGPGITSLDSGAAMGDSPLQ